MEKRDMETREERLSKMEAGNMVNTRLTTAVDSKGNRVAGSQNLHSLPEYRCHKVVRAAKVNRVVENPNGSVDLFFESPPSGADVPMPVNAEESFVQRHSPKAGAYFVLYADGYASMSPPEAFEDGYILMDDGYEKAPGKG